MAFVILILVLVGLAIWAGISVGKEESVGEGIGCGLTIAIIGGFLGSLILGGIGGMTAEQADRKLLETRTLTVAEGSPFETENGYIEFVEKKEDGRLEAHDQSYTELKYESLNIKQVEIKKYEVYHFNVFPWVWGSSHYITVK